MNALKTTMKEITSRTCSKIALRNTMIMWLKETLKSLLGTLKITNIRTTLDKGLESDPHALDKSVPLKLLNWFNKGILAQTYQKILEQCL